MFELTKNDLTKSKGGLNPLYWKKEKFTNSKGRTTLRVVPGTGPTLYTKLIYSKKNKKFLSQFFDYNDNPIDPLDLIEKYSADALRFTLLSMASPGRDVKLSEDRVKGYRNFLNKLWNANNFLIQNKCSFKNAHKKPKISININILVYNF